MTSRKQPSDVHRWLLAEATGRDLRADVVSVLACGIAGAINDRIRAIVARLRELTCGAEDAQEGAFSNSWPA
jgi:hypothetical protein